MSERGVFAVDRGIWTDPDFADEAFTEREAFIWLVSEAAWKRTRKRADGKVVELERGQLCHSVRFMAAAWGWSKSRVDRFLSRLESRDMIKRDSGTRFQILTVCNYDRFQRVALPERDEVGTTSGTRAGQERDKLENIENIEIDNMSETSGSDASLGCQAAGSEEPSQTAARPDDLFEARPGGGSSPVPEPEPAKPKTQKRNTYPEAFEDLWRAYPTDPLMSKSKAFSVWQRLDNDDRRLAMAGVPGFVAHCRKNPTYRPVHLERFLRDRRFEGFAKAAQATVASAAPNGSSDRERGQRALLRRWQTSPHSWPAAMGPRPNEPGCQIPGALLAEFGIQVSPRPNAPSSGAAH